MNPLSNYKILGNKIESSCKQFHCGFVMPSFFDSVEKVLETQENDGYCYFLLFQWCFPVLSIRVNKSQDYVVKG